MLDVAASRLRVGDSVWLMTRRERILASVKSIRHGCLSELIPLELASYARKEPVIFVDFNLHRNAPMRDLIDTDLSWSASRWTLPLKPTAICKVQPKQQRKKR